MLTFFAFICGLVAIVGTIALILLICTIEVHRSKFIPLFIFPVLAVFGFRYTWNVEEEYFHKHGDPYVMYAQVKAISENRITVYGDNRNNSSVTTLLKSKADFTGIAEEDIVRITYFNGTYHHLIIRLEKLLPAR